MYLHTQTHTHTQHYCNNAIRTTFDPNPGLEEFETTLHSAAHFSFPAMIFAAYNKTHARRARNYIILCVV